MFAKATDNTLSKVESFFSVLGALAVVFIMAGVTTQIIARYVFRSAFPGIYESAELLIVLVVFLSLSEIQARRGHICMDFIMRKMPPKVDRAISTIMLVLALALFVMITIRSGMYAYLQWSTGAVSMGVIDFPLWPQRIFVPIGTALISIRLIYQIIVGLPPRAEEK